MAQTEDVGEKGPHHVISGIYYCKQTTDPRAIPLPVLQESISHKTQASSSHGA
jgi:hypothetical protein